MKISRTKNTIYGTFWGIIYRLMCTIIPFAIRTIIIKEFGEQYVGLNSLFTSILQVLSLSELGLSSAVVFSMYKPIANDDNVLICALMNFYKKTYFIIGAIILILGLLCLPFLPHLINGNVPNGINIYILYLLFLSNTCISYFFFGYKEALLIAYQRNDIINLIRFIVMIMQYLAQIIVLLALRNFYVYVLCITIFTIIRAFFNSLVVNKKYPQIHCYGDVPKEEINVIKKNMFGIAVGKVSVVARGASDNIIISAFLSLSALAMFDNYYYIISAVIAFLTIIENSLISGVGNTIVVDDIDKVFSDFQKISFIFMLISGICVSCLLCLFQPFMKMWVGDILMLSTFEMVLFCLYFYVSTMSTIGSVYITASGLWDKLKIKSVLEVIFNLCVNLLLVNLLGIKGILIATIISLFVFSFGWSGFILFKNLFFNYNLRKYYITHTIFIFITIFLSVSSFFVCSFISISNPVLELIIRLLIACFVPLIGFVLFFLRTNVFKQACHQLETFLLKKKKR